MSSGDKPLVALLVRMESPELQQSSQFLQVKSTTHNDKTVIATEVDLRGSASTFQASLNLLIVSFEYTTLYECA